MKVPRPVYYRIPELRVLDRKLRELGSYWQHDYSLFVVSLEIGIKSLLLSAIG